MKNSSVRSSSRRGAVLVAAVACLALVSLLSVVVIQTSYQLSQRGRVLESRLQAQWLAESGVDRGAILLRNDPEFRQETWTIDTGMLPDDGGSAVVTIVVEPAPGPERSLVRATAVYQPAGGHAITEARELLVARDSKP